jgi:ABC-type Fe3+ transport system permease subunit
MAVLVWFTVGMAIWHFTVFLPDRFWGGIVGALLGAVAGALVTGAAAHLATGDSVGDTGIDTVLYAIPGTLLGLAVIWFIGRGHVPDADPYEPPSGRRA